MRYSLIKWTVTIVTVLCIATIGLAVFFSSETQSPDNVDNVDFESGAAWSNPSYAKASDNSRAAVDACEGTDYLWAYDFGFSIPGGATIDGVEVSLEGYEPDIFHPTFGPENYWKLRLAYGDLYTLIGNEKLASGLDGGPPDSTHTTGSPTDTWSASLSSSIVNAETFGVAHWVDYKHGSSCGDSYWIDHIEIEVYYTTESGSSFSQTRSTGAMTSVK